MCFYCKCKTTKPSVTTHVVTFDNCVIIIKNVPCEECEECGEKYFSDEVMSRLEKIVEKAREIAMQIAEKSDMRKAIIKVHKVLSFIQSTLCIRISQESAVRFHPYENSQY